MAKKTNFQSSGTTIPCDLYSFIVSPVQQVIWSPKQRNTKQVETDEQEEHLSVSVFVDFSFCVTYMLFCGLQHCGHLKRKVPRFQSELQMLLLPVNLLSKSLPHLLWCSDVLMAWLLIIFNIFAFTKVPNIQKCNLSQSHTFVVSY